MTFRRLAGLAAALAAPALLSACATVLSPPAAVPAEPPARWTAPLPHQGDVTALAEWWSRHGDPVLVQLIGAAQSVSPTIASARSRLEQARSLRTAAGGALLPTLDAGVNAVRASKQPDRPLGTTATAALQTAWEIDIFGANWAARSAAQSRLQGADAAWHEARVAVAADVANAYYGLRACEKLLAIAHADAASRGETARLSDLSAKAGFTAPATAALARASAAESSARATQQKAECDIAVKQLVALTALPEADLRQKLAASRAAEPSPIAIASLPAQVLAQRPDVYAAELDVAAASADVGSARAQRLPRVTLAGNVGRVNFQGGGIDATESVWQAGPLAISLPIFDAGRRAANVDAARARYDEAVALYRASVRNAVREIEEALVNLESTAARSEAAKIAVEGYRQSFEATEARHRAGLASLVELEDARRVRLAAENALVTLELQRRTAWVGLYRAAGGGWSAPAGEERTAAAATAGAAQ